MGAAGAFTSLKEQWLKIVGLSFLHRTLPLGPNWPEGRPLRTNFNFVNLNYSVKIENTTKLTCMEHEQTTSLCNPKKGENVIFSFLVVA